MLVTQAIIGHHAVQTSGNDGSILHCTLGVLQEIHNLPSEFQKLFVPSLDFKTPSYLRRLLKLPVDGKKKCKDVVDRLLRFVEKSSEEGNTAI